MRGAWSLTDIAVSDAGSTIACLAARGVAVCAVPIDATRLAPTLALANSLRATSHRPRRALVHNSSGVPACRAVPPHPHIIGVIHHSLQPVAIRLVSAFVPLPPYTAQLSSAAQTRVPLRRPHQGLQRQRFSLSTILTIDHGGTGNDHDHTRGW